MDWIRSKIRAIRSQKKYSQEKMAELLDIEQTTYSNWETGKIDITLKNIERIAKVLDVDVAEIWDRTKWEIPVSQFAESKVEYLLNKNRGDLQKEIEILKEQNLALTRAYNELYEKKADRKLMLH